MFCCVYFCLCHLERFSLALSSHSRLHGVFLTNLYSLIQMKCQGGNKYMLSITVKFDQSTRRFGKISFASLFKLTKHIALLSYLLSPYLLSCMRCSRNVRKNMHIIKTILKFCASEHRLWYDEFRRRWDSNSGSQVCAALQRPIVVNVSIVRNSGTRYM